VIDNNFDKWLVKLAKIFDFGKNDQITSKYFSIIKPIPFTNGIN